MAELSIQELEGMIYSITYRRVSTPDQILNHSLDYQLSAMREYEISHGFINRGDFWDEGISGRTIGKRQGIQAAIEFALSSLPEGSYFMVYDASRMCRDTDDASYIYRELRGAGIFIATPNKVYEHNAAGKRQWLLDSVDADYDSGVKSEETLKRMKSAAESGRYVTTAPFGYLNPKAHRITTDKSLLSQPDEEEVIVQIFTAIARGEDKESVTKRLMNNSVWTRHFKSKLATTHKKRMEALVKNRIFIGKNLTKQMTEEVDGNWEPLVSEELFIEANNMLNGVTYKKVDNSDIFPLVGLLECALCGRSYTNSTVTKPNGDKYFYYFCGRPKCSKKSITTESALLQVEEILGGLKIAEPMRKDLINCIREGAQEAVALAQSKLRDANREINDAINLRNSYIEGLATGKFIGLNDLTPITSEINKQNEKIKDLTASLPTLQVPENEWIEEALKVAAEMLCDPLKTWKELGPTHKNKFLGALFPTRLKCADRKVQTPVSLATIEDGVENGPTSVTWHPQRDSNSQTGCSTI
jgi:DNA invertase Pin-like site-specific DNA recombinase